MDCVVRSATTLRLNRRNNESGPNTEIRLIKPNVDGWCAENYTQWKLSCLRRRDIISLGYGRTRRVAVVLAFDNPVEERLNGIKARCCALRFFRRTGRMDPEK